MTKLRLAMAVTVLFMPAPGIAEDDPIKTTQEFLGYTWSVGLAMAQDFEEGRVETASLVNDLVRVEDEERARGVTMLEMHRILWGSSVRNFKSGLAKYNRLRAQGSMDEVKVNAAMRVGSQPELQAARADFSRLGLTPGEVTALLDEQPQWGWGLFVAVQPSDSNVIDSLAVGPMLGWRASKEDTHGYGIGLGLVLDTEAKILGEGIEANQALPTGETTVRFKTEERLGILVLLTFGLK